MLSQRSTQNMFYLWQLYGNLWYNLCGNYITQNTKHWSRAGVIVCRFTIDLVASCMHCKMAWDNFRGPSWRRLGQFLGTVQALGSYRGSRAPLRVILVPFSVSNLGSSGALHAMISYSGQELSCRFRTPPRVV